MARIANGYSGKQGEHFFQKLFEQVATFRAQYPDADLCDLSVGDAKLPTSPVIAQAIAKAAHEQTTNAMRGYSPLAGYDFVRKQIADKLYKGLISYDEIFLSDGSKCDSSAIHEIFSHDSTVLVTDPIYPVYRNANLLAGKSADQIAFLPLSEESGWVPRPPEKGYDLIYLCSPGNPTGTAMTRSVIEEWIAYAKKHRSILLVDGCYAMFSTNKEVPRTIYEVPGAKEVAIEFYSLSKSHSFSGIRGAHTVVPKDIIGESDDGPVPLHPLWTRRMANRFNGVSYPIQRGIEAAYSDEGMADAKRNIAHYMECAAALKEALVAAHFTCYGGENAPFLWIKVPDHFAQAHPSDPSGAFFSHLLSEHHLICSPGTGFGPSGHGWFRLSCLIDEKTKNQTIKRIKEYAIRNYPDPR